MILGGAANDKSIKIFREQEVVESAVNINKTNLEINTSDAEIKLKLFIRLNKI